MTVWIAVLVVGAVSYASRLVPWLVLDRMEVGPQVEAVLRYAGVGAITALLVGGLLHPQASGRPVPAVLAAVAVSGVLMWRGRSGLLAIGLGMGTFLAVDLLVTQVAPVFSS
jgi:branched-subunit amino acid transport protein